ncbi:hypothetical protein JW978_02380, partial [Candidatus Dojkabacteria bacterium]|nr:hypothetical protein [Candidatus Dojkabacteria bacterium]
MCFCCLCCVSLFFVAGRFLSNEVDTISEEVLYPLCQTDGNLSTSDYNKYFDGTEMTITEAELSVEDAFSNYSDCNDFKGKNVFQRLMGGHSFEISSTTDEGSNATYSFTNNSTKYTFFLNKDSGEWLITSID